MGKKKTQRKRQLWQSYSKTDIIIDKYAIHVIYCTWSVNTFQTGNK